MVGAFLVFVPAVPYGVLQLASPGAATAPLPPRAEDVAHAGPDVEDGPSPLSAKAVREPAALERLNTDAAIAVGGTPAEFAAFIELERKRWQPVIVRAKIKPD